MWGLVDIRQKQLTEGATVSLFVSLIVLSRRDKSFLTSLRNFHSYSLNRRNSICFMMFGWKRTFYNFRESFTRLFGFQPILTILFVSVIVLSRRDKAFLTSLWNFKSCLSNWRNWICFMIFEWNRTCQKLWECFARLFGFQPILTILIGFRPIRFNWPISKHCNIFLSTAPINQLILLIYSQVRKDRFTAIVEISETFDKGN